MDKTDTFSIRGERSQPELQTPPFHQWTSPDGTPWADFHRLGADYLVRFPGLADFTISSDGHATQGWGCPQVDEQTLHHLYLNQVLPLALGRQGQLVLHGSAIEVHNTAIAFMGPSGYGKSTLAASFARHGFRFLTDDGLVLEPSGAQWLVQPSHPSIRLWEDSEAALALETLPKAPAVNYTTKSRFLAGDDIVLCDQPRPLRRMYFLGNEEVDEPALTPLKPGEAVIALVRNSFLLDTEEHRALAAHFEELCSLVTLDAFYRLDYPRRYDDLPRVRQIILEHAFPSHDRP